MALLRFFGLKFCECGQPKNASAKALEDAISNIRGAVMIVYPMGLPDYDHVRQILEEREELEGASVRVPQGPPPPFSGRGFQSAEHASEPHP